MASQDAPSAVWGVFAIHQLDAARLQQGLQQLSASDPERARSVRERARKSVERLVEDFPGDPATGLLDTSEEAEARFEDFANDEPCAALDPRTGLCDLYLARPMTCRVLGPRALGAGAGRVRALLSRRHGGADCRLRNARRPRGLEAQLLAEFEQSSGRRGRTLVAFALDGT